MLERGIITPERKIMGSLIRLKVVIICVGSLTAKAIRVPKAEDWIDVRSTASRRSIGLMGRAPIRRYTMDRLTAKAISPKSIPPRAFPSAIEVSLVGNRSSLSNDPNLLSNIIDEFNSNELTGYTELQGYENINITLIDLDKGMVKVSKEKPLSILNEKAFYYENVKVINSDAFVYIDNFIKNKKKFDLIVIDFPDPSNINLAKLYSLEFYKKLYKILASNGVVSVQATSPYFASKTFLCIDKTLRNAGFNTIKYHYDIPSFGDWGFIIGYKLDKGLMEKRINNFSLKTINTYFLTDKLFKASLIFPKNWIKTTEKNIEINSIFNPVIVRYYNEETKFDW